MYKRRSGMYCSRQFADWMFKKNRQELDYPVYTLQKLIRLFCRPNYNEFFLEEERKGNQFYYDIIDEGGRITFKSSYELVFLPYDGCTRADLERVEGFIPGYRILQMRECMPVSPKNETTFYDLFCYGHAHLGYTTVHYVAEMIVDRAKEIKKFAKSKKIDIGRILNEHADANLGFNPYSEISFDDEYNLFEFQRSEMPDSIDFHTCPDGEICRHTFVRIINHLMKETDRMGLIADKKGRYYELRVAAFVAAILSYAGKQDFSVTKGIDKAELVGRGEEFFEEYCRSGLCERRFGIDPDVLCRRIRVGLLWDLNIVIDRSYRLVYDFDYWDTAEAQIGMTAEDEWEMSQSSRKTDEASDDPVAEEDCNDYSDLIEIDEDDFDDSDDLDAPNKSDEDEDDWWN